MESRWQTPTARQDAREADHLVPVEHFTLYEQVYEKLRLAIMEGAFAAGETLTIRSLAQRLGTSVMPVREALRRLSTEGALTMLPNRSIRVPPLDVARIAEVYALRSLLEGEAAALAAATITDEELARVKHHHRDFIAGVKAGSASKILRAGQDLHFTIYEAARSPTMLAFIGMLWLQTGPWLAEPLRRTFSKRTVQTFAEAIGARHGEIIDALQARDAQRAARAVRAEMRDLAEHLRATIGEAHR